MMRSWISLLLLFLLLPIGALRAQVRSEGLAGAGSAIVDGTDAPLRNPARLTIVGGPRLRLIDTFGAISNNSYSLSDYRAYNGADLSKKDEEEILRKIAGDALEADGVVRVQGPSFRHGSWAITLRTIGNADAGLPKEMLRLLLDGNTPEETFSFNATRGGGELFSEVGLSHAHTVTLPHSGTVHIGATLKWIRGWLYGKLRSASGSIRTTVDGVEGGGELRFRSATGGNGFGLDLGAWREIRPSWTASFVLRDLFTAIRWNRGTQEAHTRFVVRETTLQDLEGGEDIVDSEDETYPIRAFRSTIPPVVIAGIAHTHRRWTFVADWTQGFEESIFTTRTPRLAIGTEMRIREWLAGRAGLSVGGLDRRSLALGLGLSPGFLRIDLALAARDGYVPFIGRGIGLGLAVGTEF